MSMIRRGDFLASDVTRRLAFQGFEEATMTNAPTGRGRLVAAVFAAALVALTAAFSATPARATAAPARPTVAAAVTIRGSSFVPATLSITAGQQVVWTNANSTTHTVTADDGSFNGTAAPGGQFTATFSRAGNYPYHCSIHPFMTGTIIVS
jgi:plastocyanin